MEKKKISELTEEILRQQLELLAERSKDCEDGDLANLTNAMISLGAYLSSSDFNKL